MKNCPNCGAPIKKYQTVCSYCNTEQEREETFEEDLFDGDWVMKFIVSTEWAIDLASYTRDCTTENYFSKILKDRAAHKIADKLKPYIQIRVRDFDPICDGVEVVARVKGIKRRLEEMHFEENPYSL